MKVRVELTVMEGWADHPGNRMAEHLDREYDLPAIPRKGDYLDTGRGDEPVEVVFWPMDGRAPLVRLRRTYTLSESMDDVLAVLASLGWER